MSFKGRGKLGRFIRGESSETAVCEKKENTSAIIRRVLRLEIPN